MATHEDHRALIEAIGSQTLRKRFRITRAGLHNWRRRGVPAVYRPAVAELAELFEVELPPDFLAPPMNGRPRRRDISQ